MSPEFRKAALREKGYTAARLADELGVGRSMVSQVLNGTAQSRRIQMRAAEILDVPFADVWPVRVSTLRRDARSHAVS